MIIIEKERRSGRTTLLLNDMRLNRDSVLIVSTHEEKRFCRGEYMRMYDEDIGDRILTTTELQKLRGRAHHPRILIDNLERVLAVILGDEPEVVVVTKT